MTDQLRQAAMQQALVDVITVTLMREGINKHRARELADHFVNFTLTPPLPVQESVSMRMPKVGDKVICLEDESLGEVVSLTAGGSPDIKFDDGSHGTYLLREFAELFGYVASPLPVQEPVGDEWTPCMKLPVVVHVRQQRPDEAHVSTREGITPVKPDDLIMRGVSGEEYPIGRAIFEQTYSLNTTRWDSPTLQAPALAGWKAALRGKNT